MSRTAEFIFGFIGSLIGIVAALMAGSLGGLGAAVNSGDPIADRLMMGGGIALVISIIASIGSMFVWKSPRVSGAIMVSAALIGIVSAMFFYILPFIMLLTGGLMALLRKEKVELKKSSLSCGM